MNKKVVAAIIALTVTSAGAVARMIVNKKRKGKRFFGFQWHITDLCDQRCDHCYYDWKNNPCVTNGLPLKKLISILDNIVKSCDEMERRPFLTITGGDPLLYKNVWPFFFELQRRGIEFAILGNPFHLTDEIARRLRSLGCIKYQMSLDGLEETHDKIRKPGSFKATLSKIKVLQNAGIRVNIMTTVSKTNMDEIPDLVDVIVEHGADSCTFARYCPNSGDEDLMPTPEEYKAFMQKMWDKYTEHKDSDTQFILKDHLWKLFLSEKGIFDIKSIKNPKNLILDGCHCGISHLTILADGTVYACRRSETPVGNALEDKLSDVFLGSKMEAYRNYDGFEKCSKCELLTVCRGCPSVAKSATGNFYAADPQCWKEIDE